MSTSFKNNQTISGVMTTRFPSTNLFLYLDEASDVVNINLSTQSNTDQNVYIKKMVLLHFN